MYKLIKNLILSIMLMMFFVSCNDSTNKSSENIQQEIIEKTKFEDIQNSRVNKFLKAFSNLNIKNTEELKKQLNSEDMLDVFMKLKKVDNNIKAEDFRRLLKTLEDEIVWKNLLEEKTISQKEYDSIKITNKLISNLKLGEFRNFKSFEENDSLSTNASQKYLKDQVINFNNDLSSYGKELFTTKEFKQLKEKINSVNNIFLDKGASLQNVVKNNTIKTRSIRSLYTNNMSDNYTIINPVKELSENISFIDDAQKKVIKENLCHLKTQSFPFEVVGQNLQNNTFLSIGTIENEFYINDTGLAQVLLYNKSNKNQKVEIKHRNKTIFSNDIPSQRYIATYIPILKKDICTLYKITNNKDLTVKINFSKAKKMEKKLDKTNGKYYFKEEIYSYKNQEANIYEFSLSNSSVQNAILIEEDSSRSYLNMHYILISPSNKMYLGELYENKNIKFKEEIGKWTLVALPYKDNEQNNKFKIRNEDTSNIENFGINYISTLPLINGASNSGFFENIKISINKQTNRKKFIIGEMKKAEFATDGEEDKDYNAEVVLYMKTNVAPKLQIGESLASDEASKVRFQAYKCFIDNNKDILTFYENGICSTYKNGLEDSLKELSIFPFGLDIEDSKSLKRHLNTYEWYYKSKYNDATFLLADKYKNIYDNWENSISQINNIKFPYKYHYSITEKISGGRIHPIIPINMPILAITKKRLSKTLDPIAFSYNAVDMDETNNLAIFGSAAKYVLNQTLAVLTGNIAGLVCNNVEFLKDMRKIEVNAEDEEIGNANLYLNRFSAKDQFYGLNNGKFKLSSSGFADTTREYTSEDKALNYASIACSASGMATAAYDLANTAQNIYNGQYITLINKLNALIDTFSNTSEIYNNATQIKTALENGTATKEQINEFLKEESILDLVTNGSDVFGNIEDIKNLGGIGSQGYNSIHSEAKYYYSDFSEAKTRGVFEFKEVDAIPVKNIKVNLNKVHIVANYEDGNAEVKLRTRVGVVSDKTPKYQGRFKNSAPFMLDGKLLYENGSDGYKTLPNLPFKGYLLRSENFNGISDDEELNLNGKSLLYSAKYPDNNNVAAIYVEIGIFEGDGGGTDDDMIGVLSNTYYLEDIFNTSGNLTWKKMSNNKYKLSIKDYPVYTTENLQSSVELINKENREFQKNHNKKARNNPCAKISFDIILDLDDFSENEIVKIEDYLNYVTFKSEDDILDIKNLNLQEITSLSLKDTKLFAHNKDKTKYIIYGNDTISIIKLDDKYNLTVEKTLKKEQLENNYRYLLDSTSTPNKQVESINFIDENNVALVYRTSKEKQQEGIVTLNTTYEYTRQIAIIDINSALVKKVINLTKDAKVFFQRKADSLRYFLLSPTYNNNNIKGNISLYSINKYGKKLLLSKDIVAGIPKDIDFINKNNILVTINNYDKNLYTIYKVDNSFNETGIYEYKITTSNSYWGAPPNYDIASFNQYYNSKHNLWYFENRYNNNAYVDINDSKNRVLRSFNLLYNENKDTYSFNGTQDQKIKEKFNNNEYITVDDQENIIFSDNNIFIDKNSNFSTMNYFMIDNRYMFASISTKNNKHYKIIDTQYTNKKPEVEVVSYAKLLKPNEEFTFKATVYDFDKEDTHTYKWYYTKDNNIQKITIGTTKSINYKFKDSGKYTIFFEAKDSSNNVSLDSKDIVVNSPATVTISPNRKQIVQLNSTLNFSAQVNDLEQDNLTYNWSYIKFENEDSISQIISTNNKVGVFTTIGTTKNITYRFNNSGKFRFKFTVNDDYGVKVKKYVDIEVEKTNVYLDLDDINITVYPKTPKIIDVSNPNLPNLYVIKPFENPQKGSVKFEKNPQSIIYESNTCEEGADNLIYKISPSNNSLDYDKYGKINIKIIKKEMETDVVNKEKTIYSNELIEKEKLLKTAPNIDIKITKQPKNGKLSLYKSNDDLYYMYDYYSPSVAMGDDYFEYTLTETYNGCSQTKVGKVSIKILESEKELIHYCKDFDSGKALYETYGRNITLINKLKKDTETNDPYLYFPSIKINDKNYFVKCRNVFLNGCTLYSSDGTLTNTIDYNENIKVFDPLVKIDDSVIFMGKDTTNKIFKVDSNNTFIKELFKIDTTISGISSIEGKSLYYMAIYNGQMHILKTDGINNTIVAESQSDQSITDPSYNRLYDVKEINSNVVLNISQQVKTDIYSIEDKKLINLTEEFRTENAVIKEHLYKINNKVYFTMYDYKEGYTIFETDGTKQGTKKLLTTKDSLFSMGVSNNKIYFYKNYYETSTSNEDDENHDLLVFNPATNKIEILKKKISTEISFITNNKFNDSLAFNKLNPSILPKDKCLFLIYKEKSKISELWVSNGTTEGTIILKTNIKYGIDKVRVYKINSKYYIQLGNAHYETDFTPKGTKLVLDDYCDITPDKISLEPVYDVLPNAIQKTSAIITGITNPKTPISIQNGEYSLDDGITWLKGATTISNNQKVLIKHQSSNKANTLVTTILKVGTSNISFETTTKP